MTSVKLSSYAEFFNQFQISVATPAGDVFKVSFALAN